MILYDLPLQSQGPAGPDHAAHLAALLAAGDRGAAVEYFQAQIVGIPAHVVAALRHAPFRPALEAMAHTLVYEAILLGDGRLSFGAHAVRTLVAAGRGSPPFMLATAELLARSLPHGEATIIEGATHDLVPERLGPVFEAFLSSR
jgi:pimeloyl-ACP methyl ester carboxylesterase